jgi:hypothetical protein
LVKHLNAVAEINQQERVTMLVPVGTIVAKSDANVGAVTFRDGQIGRIINKISEAWWNVQFGLRQGLIPSHLVSEVLSFAVAEFDYTAQDDTEVTFQKEDGILILEKLDADWWIGQVAGMRGIFPSAYTMEKPLHKAKAPFKKWHMLFEMSGSSPTVEKAPFKWQLEAAKERHYEEDFPDKSPFLDLRLRNGLAMFEEALQVIESVNSPNYQQLVFEVRKGFDSRVLQLADAVADGLRRRSIQVQELFLDLDFGGLKEDQMLQIVAGVRAMLAELPRLAMLKIHGELSNQCVNALVAQLKKVELYGTLSISIEDGSSGEILSKIADQAALETVILHCQTKTPPLEKFITDLGSLSCLTKLTISSGRSFSCIDDQYLGNFILGNRKLEHSVWLI